MLEALPDATLLVYPGLGLALHAVAQTYIPGPTT